MSSASPLRTEQTAFLIGCARSGTSILGESLAAQPRITYLYEVSAIWKRVFPDRPDDRLVAADASDSETIQRLHAELAARMTDPERDILLEKNPKHTLRVAFLDRAFPGCRFLHIIRDARDTVASLMFRNRGLEWGHLKIPGWKDLLEKHPEANHLRCAHQWRDSVRLARQEGSALDSDRYLEIRFEDLVARPVEIVTAAMAFLGLEMTETVRETCSRIQDETARSYHARRQVRHFVDNHQRRVGRYRENLTETQRAEVEAICGELMRELGYESESESESDFRSPSPDL